MLEKLRIEGGHRLEGEVTISGAKNSALPILASTILSSGVSEIENVPRLKDVETILRLLRLFGAEVDWRQNQVRVDAEDLIAFEAPYDLVRTMRASVLFLGPLLARLGKARISLPGGCAIGARPINLHLEALKKLGANIKLEGGYVEATCDRLIGNEVVFEMPTVTGTMNAIMAASLAKGESVIKNSAREPEIDDLIICLNERGARIERRGVEIHVQGVEELGPARHSIMADRIETGTYLAAAAITGGDITTLGLEPSHIAAVLEKFREAGFEITEGVRDDKPWIRLHTQSRGKAVDIDTQPFPGFPTDMQAQMMAVLALSEGSSAISENIFENRFMHVSELKRMGANLKIRGNTVLVQGVDSLSGAPVMATDLRASASLVLAALGAQGTTEVLRIYHLDRGYEDMDAKLRDLGAHIERLRQ